MYRRILLATDGSALAQLAAEQGIRLAKGVGAAVVAVYASPPFSSPEVFEFVPAPTASLPAFDEKMDAEAAAHLGAVRTAAAQAGVPCKLMHLRGLPAAQAIATSAKSENCDLIVLGSHGHTALAQLLMGSVTTRVLATSFVPVLVYRKAPARRPRKT